MTRYNNKQFKRTLRKTATAFVTSQGVHRKPNNMGSQYGKAANDFSKKAKKLTPGSSKVTKDTFNTIHQMTESTSDVRMALFSDAIKVLIKVVGAHANHPLFEKHNTCLSHHVTISNKNVSAYEKTFVDIGVSFRKRVQQLINGPHSLLQNKTLKSSEEDYQSTTKRKQLVSTVGFNEKGFSFYKNDLIIQVKDIMNLCQINSRFKKLFLRTNEGAPTIRGLVTESKIQLKIRNRTQFYNAFVKIHLIRITDLDTDVNSLVEEIFHQPVTKEETKSTDNFDKRGKIARDLQVSMPKINTANQFSINIRTRLNATLSKSDNFRNKSQVVETWTKQLTPGSTWEFNLRHRLGWGINLNKIFEMEAINPEHPVSYVLVSEYVGDRRGSIIRHSDGAQFSGYSPIKLNHEFRKSIKYLVEHTEREKVQYTQDEESVNTFEPDSIFEEIFTPNRKLPFTVAHDDIGFPGSSNPEKREFSMEYDTEFEIDASMWNTQLQKVKNSLEREGIDPSTASLEDIKLNYDKDEGDFSKGESNSENDVINSILSSMNDLADNEDSDEDETNYLRQGE